LRRKVCFFEKKKPKTFTSGIGCGGNARQGKQKFFGSFFQKRTFFLPMNLFTSVVLFVLIWWTVLFAVLPLGTRPLAEPDSVTGWRGAPEKPQLLRKVLITTVASAMIWGFAIGIIESNWLSFRHGILKLPDN